MKILITSIILLLWAGNGYALLENQNLFVTTGRDGTESSDRSQSSLFFFSVDKTLGSPLFVRVFDADIGGVLDVAYPDSMVRYQIFNSLADDAAPLAALKLGRSKFYDNQWRSIAKLNHRDGELVDDRLVYRLLVEGISDKGSNKFQIFISSEEKKNTPVPGLRLYSPSINLQLPAAQAMDTEIRFTIPPQAEQLKITNLDADSVAYDATVNFSSQARPRVPLKTSNDRTASVTELEILPEERGEQGAVVFSSAEVNFVQMWIEDEEDKPVMLELPVFLAPANHPPEPKIAITPLSGCNQVLLDASGSVDRDEDELDYYWLFPDNSTAVGSRITHNFKQPGQYEVTLIVKDDSGFTANQTDFAFPVIINRPPLARITAPSSAVVGETITFDGSTSSDDDGTITRYLWEFGEGTKEKGVSVSHHFARPGLYRVSLLVEDDSQALCANDRIEHLIRINAPPVARFQVKPVVAPGERVTLDGGESIDSDGSITAWNWDFGDQTTATGEQATKVWKEPGTYTIHLEVTDDSNLDNGVAEEFGQVVVNAPPKADLKAVPPVIAVADPITFTGSGSHDPDGKLISYLWDFGDNSGAAEADTRHSYQQPGEYTVRLTITDNSGVGNAVVTRQQTIRVNHPPVPVAEPDILVNSSRIDFDGTLSTDDDDDIIAWQWDFGDGSRSDQARTSHVYTLPGVYTARLAVTDASGTSSATRTTQRNITINHPPQADAGANQTIAVNDTAHFNGSTSVDIDGIITAWNWLIDNQHLTGARVSHRFERSGQYQISLTVQDNNNSTHTSWSTVTVNQPPVARFAPLPRIEPGQRVILDGSQSHDSDGRITEYSWQSGDGSKVREDKKQRKQFQHRYKEPGRYRAILTVQDDSGVSNDRATVSQTVKVNYPPAADAGQDIHTCEQVIQFDGSASSDADLDALSYEWDFGDNTTGRGQQVVHQFVRQGNYPVTLTTDDNTGLGNSSTSSSITVRINSAPSAVIKTEGETFCAGEHVLFDGSGSFDPEKGMLRYLWNLGDEQTVEDVNPVRVFTRGGDYTIDLKVIDDSGLDCNSSHDRKEIHVVDAPIAAAGEDIEICANTMLEFDGSRSTGGGRPIISYEWNFGDGSSGAGEVTSHAFATAGYYTSRLTIQAAASELCENSSMDERKVRVHSTPRADFLSENGCVGQPVSFDGSISEKFNPPDTTYTYQFGDEQSSPGIQSHHTYSEPGTYEVILQVESSEDTGCSKGESRQMVRINAIPAADIVLRQAGQEADSQTGNEVLTNSLLLFSGIGSSDNDGRIQFYHWDFGDNDEAKGSTAEHRYKKRGLYTVRLTVQDNSDVACNRNTAEMLIKSTDFSQPVINGPDQVCVSGRESWSLGIRRGEVSWDFGDGSKGEGQLVEKIYNRPGSYEIRTFMDGSPVRAIQVEALAMPEIELPTRLTVMAGEEVTLTGHALTATGLDFRFHWNMGDGTIIEKETALHSYLEPGTYTATLTITAHDTLPCLESSHQIDITVLPKPKAVISHEPEEIFSGGARDEVVFQALLSDNDKREHDDLNNWNFYWDFGDNEQARGAVVSHYYQRAGTYTVTLTLRDGSGVAHQAYTFSREVEVNEWAKE